MSGMILAEPRGRCATRKMVVHAQAPTQRMGLLAVTLLNERMLQISSRAGEAFVRRALRFGGCYARTLSYAARVARWP